MNHNKIISDYFDAKEALHEIFGYQADWVEIPMEDYREYYWMLTKGEDGGPVVYSKKPFTPESLKAGTEIYSGRIYTQRFLPKWVYRGDKHVMVSVDTQTDGNKLLMIFEADKECTDDAMRNLYEECW